MSAPNNVVELPDLIIEDHGSLSILRPATEDGRAWVDDNIFSDPGVAVTWDGNVVVEHRYVRDIVEGALRDYPHRENQERRLRPMITATLTPAYGREFKSGAEVLTHYRNNGDFLLNDASSRWYQKPINREQLLDSKYTHAQLRYNQLRNVIVINIQEDAFNEHGTD